MTDWRRVAERLAQSLRAMPCRCDFQRSPGGVPLWFPKADGSGGIERKLIRQCSRCAALEIHDVSIERAA
jgi:hypothetical protein